MRTNFMRIGCFGMLLLAAVIVDGAGNGPYSSQAFWPMIILAMGVAVGGIALGVRAEILDPVKDPEIKRPRPCGNTDRAKEVGFAVSTKNIPCMDRKSKHESLHARGRRFCEQQNGEEPSRATAPENIHVRGRRCG